MDLVRVPFHGDELLAARDDRGVWVPVKRVCEALGVDESRQRKKLGMKAWAVTDMKSATGPDSKNYEMFCIHLDSLPMWLATIEPSRVSESVRSKLERYQLECAKVLRDHFFGRPPEPRIDIAQVIAATVSEVVKVLPALIREAMVDVASTAAVNGTIGRHGANRVRAALREYADLFTGEPRASTSWKSCHKKADNDLRKSVSHTIRAWGLLPVAKEGDVTGRLDDMLRLAREIAAQRQAWRAKQMGLAFPDPAAE